MNELEKRARKHKRKQKYPMSIFPDYKKGAEEFNKNSTPINQDALSSAEASSGMAEGIERNKRKGINEEMDDFLYWEIAEPQCTGYDCDDNIEYVYGDNENRVWIEQDGRKYKVFVNQVDEKPTATFTSLNKAEAFGEKYWQDNYGYVNESISENLIDTEYSHTKDIAKDKEYFKNKYEKKGYKNIRVKKVKSDTKGLPMYEIYGDKEVNESLDKSLNESRNTSLEEIEEYFDSLSDSRNLPDYSEWSLKELTDYYTKLIRMLKECKRRVKEITAQVDEEGFMPLVYSIAEALTSHYYNYDYYDFNDQFDSFGDGISNIYDNFDGATIQACIDDLNDEIEDIKSDPAYGGKPFPARPLRTKRSDYGDWKKFTKFEESVNEDTVKRYSDVVPKEDRKYKLIREYDDYDSEEDFFQTKQDALDSVERLCDVVYRYNKNGHKHPLTYLTLENIKTGKSKKVSIEDMLSYYNGTNQTNESLKEGFSNGTLSDFNPQDLMDKVKSRLEAINTIRTNGNMKYMISIHPHGLFARLSPETKYDVYIVSEDEDGNQEWVSSYEEFSNLLDTEVVSKLNDWKNNAVSVNESLDNDDYDRPVMDKSNRVVNSLISNLNSSGFEVEDYEIKDNDIVVRFYDDISDRNFGFLRRSFSGPTKAFSSVTALNDYKDDDGNTTYNNMIFELRQ